MVFSFSSTMGRPGSDRKCIASKVFCRHLGQEQCFGLLMTAVGHDCIDLDIAKKVSDFSHAVEIEIHSQHEE